MADGWTSRHQNEPALLRVWLVQDQTRLVDGRIGPTRVAELATWEPALMSRLRSVATWFMPVVPESRVAILRTVLYLFVIIDIHLFVRDPIPLSRNPSCISRC